MKWDWEPVCFNQTREILDLCYCVPGIGETSVIRAKKGWSLASVNYLGSHGSKYHGVGVGNR